MLSDIDRMLLIPTSYFVYSITCATRRNDSPAPKYCPSNWSCLVLLTVMAYQMRQPASVACCDGSRVHTRLERKPAREVPFMSSEWNIMSLMAISTKSLSMSARRRILRDLTKAYIAACESRAVTNLEKRLFGLSLQPRIFDPFGALQPLVVRGVLLLTKRCLQVLNTLQATALSSHFYWYFLAGYLTESTNCPHNSFAGARDTLP